MIGSDLSISPSFSSSSLISIFQRTNLSDLIQGSRSTQSAIVISFAYRNFFLMATLGVSKLLSSRTRSNYRGVCGSEANGRVSHLKIRSSLYRGLKSPISVAEPKLHVDSKISLGHTRKSARDFSPKQTGKINCGIGMNIVFVSAECGPWSKTGGLGDVVGGLPPALAANGHRVMTICPRYDQYKDGWDTSVLAELKIGDRSYTVRFFHCYKRGVDRVFVDHPVFLEKVWGKTGGKLYGPVAGDDYADNQIKFSILCQAALEAPRMLNLKNHQHFSGPYGEDVVFVCNDWHTALLPCYLKSMYQTNGIYMNAKVAFCIHNIAYQGRFAFSDFSLLGLPDNFQSSFDFEDGYSKPVKGRKINWMKAAILQSDMVLTVSPYYATELISSRAKGVELDTYLQLRGLKGIVNGMDVQEWNPLTDKYIPVNYDSTTVTEAKAVIKESLQAELGLPVDRSVPLIGFIGRLEEQKGSDILAEAIPGFIDENVQMVALGTGKKYLEWQLEQLEERFPDKARGEAKFNVALAHLINAGADYIIIPSRFEPCGLIQLQAMRYGTCVICSSTGGLVDTVSEGITGFHMGAFNVHCEYVDKKDVAAVISTVKRALRAYGTPAFSEMIQNCMKRDLSWKGPAKQWEEALLGMNVSGSKPGIEGEEIAPLATENIPTP